LCAGMGNLPAKLRRVFGAWFLRVMGEMGWVGLRVDGVPYLLIPSIDIGSDESSI
jgi:hypothetical protein